MERRKRIGLVRLKKQAFSSQNEDRRIDPAPSPESEPPNGPSLEDYARPVGAYPGENQDQKLRSTDIFLFPSLRDRCPATLLEAMGCGCVPVVADHAGPGGILIA